MPVVVMAGTSVVTGSVVGIEVSPPFDAVVDEEISVLVDSTGLFVVGVSDSVEE
jgi:hypothetical protein